MIKNISKQKNSRTDAFTIVEILVVTIVIGILAAMTMLSYSDISDKAITAGLKSDLSSASKNLKMYNVEYGFYPSSLDSDYCPSTPISDLNYCLKFTPGTTATYTGGAQSFQLVATKSGQYYSVSESAAPSAFTPVPVIPTMTVDVNDSNIVAEINSSKSCLKGTIQYGIRSRTNDGAWGDYSEWSNISSLTISASDDVKYSFQAQSRCYFSASEQSAIVVGSEYNNAKMTAPLAPASITANTNGSSTTWNWSAAACVNGITNYQFLYTISPVGYNSGWTDNGTSSSVNFTTSTGGQTYNVQVKARCSGTYATSDWSSGVNASYYRPIVPVIANCGASSITNSTAILCANVTSDNGSSITDSGVCWGTSPSPTGNCVSNNNVGGMLTLLSSQIVSSISTTVDTYPYDIVVSPDGKSVYVVSIEGGSNPIYSTSINSNMIAMFSRNIDTGILSAMSTPTINSARPRSIAITPDGTSVYTANDAWANANTTIGTASNYSRNVTNGLLSAGSNPTATPGDSPIGIAISPDSKWVYIISAGSNTVSIYSRNMSNGSLSLVSNVSTGSVPYGIAISPDGSSVYVANVSSSSISIYSRNNSNGMLTSVSSISSAKPYSVIVSPDGSSVYASNLQSNTISMYSRNSSNGVLTAMTPATVSTGSNPWYISISPDGKSVYSANYGSNSVSMFKRNTSNGLLSPMNTASIAAENNTISVASSSDGKSVYAVNLYSKSISTYFRNSNFVSINKSYYQMTTGLPSKTTIHFRGYATSSLGTGYSADSTFVTN